MQQHADRVQEFDTVLRQHDWSSCHDKTQQGRIELPLSPPLALGFKVINFDFASHVDPVRSQPYVSAVQASVCRFTELSERPSFLLATRSISRLSILLLQPGSQRRTHKCQGKAKKNRQRVGHDAHCHCT